MRVESRFRSRAWLRHSQMVVVAAIWRLPRAWTGLDVQAGPVDELLDVSVERPAVDQLEVKVGRTLEDRFLSALTGDHWEERHLDSVD